MANHPSYSIRHFEFGKALSESNDSLPFFLIHLGILRILGNCFFRNFYLKIPLEVLKIRNIHFENFILGNPKILGKLILRKKRMIRKKFLEKID